jgi:hypothetical protein
MSAVNFRSLSGLLLGLLESWWSNQPGFSTVCLERGAVWVQLNCAHGCENPSGIIFLYSVSYLPVLWVRSLSVCEFVLASSLCLQVGEELCAIMAISERLSVIDWGGTMESYCVWK